MSISTQCTQRYMEVILQVSFSNSLYNKEAWAAEIVFQWMSQNASDDKSTLVKVMYWYHHLCCHMASLAHSELIFDMTVIICSKILSWDVLWRVLLYHFLQIISKNKPQLWVTMPRKMAKDITLCDISLYETCIKSKICNLLQTLIP